MIRVVLPYHLRTLARVNGEVDLAVGEPVTVGAVLAAIETRWPALRGVIREHGTLRRRPFVRFYVCGEDWSHDPPDRILPEDVTAGREPFLIVGAMAGG